MKIILDNQAMVIAELKKQIISNKNSEILIEKRKEQNKKWKKPPTKP